jgi:serine/threonine-protein kinase
MVAAAGERGAISPAAARRLLAGLAAALLLAVYFSPRANVVRFAGVDKSPEILRERAREILQTIGAARRADSASWFRTNGSFLVWTQSHGGPVGDLSRDAVAFVYRQSPEPLIAPLALTGPYPTPMVDSTDPAPVLPGMAEIWLDARGRLVRLSVVPPEFASDADAGSIETDWKPLFAAAGLEMARFAPVEPRRSPSHYATARAAWEGPHPEHPGVTMRVEAASYLGRPVSFDWLGPWSRPIRWQRGEQAPVSHDAEGIPIGELTFTALLMLFFFGGALLARSNLRAGRGDRRGAFRLAGFVVVLQMGMWLLGSHHVSSPLEFFLFLAALSNALGTAVVFWILYLALEPFARRRWPQMLISWTRALSGRWRDPLVGRDLLVGAVVGTAASLLLGPARVLLPLQPGPSPHVFDNEAPVNPGLAIAWLLSNAVYAIFWVLGIVFLLILARRFVRSEAVAGLIAAMIVTLVLVGDYLGDPAPAVTLLLAIVSVGVIVATTVRFGVLAATVAEACRSVFAYRIYSGDPSHWAFYAGMIAVALVLTLAWWATKTALAGRPLFGGASVLEP